MACRLVKKQRRARRSAPHLHRVSARLPRSYDIRAHRARQLPGRLSALLALVGTFPPLGVLNL
jgi:hypothetical protein